MEFSQVGIIFLIKDVSPHGLRSNTLIDTHVEP